MANRYNAHYQDTSIRLLRISQQQQQQQQQKQEWQQQQGEEGALKLKGNVITVENGMTFAVTISMGLNLNVTNVYEMSYIVQRSQ